MDSSGYCNEYPASDGVTYDAVSLDGVPTAAGDGNTWTYWLEKDDCGQAIDAEVGAVSFSWNHSAV